MKPNTKVMKKDKKKGRKTKNPKNSSILHAGSEEKYLQSVTTDLCMLQA